MYKIINFFINFFLWNLTTHSLEYMILAKISVPYNFFKLLDIVHY